GTSAVTPTTPCSVSSSTSFERQVTLSVPCIQGWTRQMKCSVVPAGAETAIAIEWCFDPSIAMVSPGLSRPGWPLSTVQWAMSVVGPGGACGFFRSGAAYRLQTAQLLI